MKEPVIKAVSIILIGLFLSFCGQNPRTQIQQASSMVCEGEANAASANYEGSGLHPIVIADEDGERHPWNDQVPEAWFPASAEETQLVVCVSEPEDVRIELCEFNGPDISRYRPDTTISIFNSKTGELVVQQTFQGEDPRSCRFSEDYDTTELHGYEVSFEDIESWLRPYVESDAQASALNPVQVPRTPRPTTMAAIKEINVFCGFLGDSPQYLEAGQQALFFWSKETTTEEYLQDYIDASSFELFVDNEWLPFATTRNEHLCEGGGFCATWKLTEPTTLGPGSHQVFLSVYLYREVTDGFDLDQDGNLDTFAPLIWSAQPACEVIAK